MLSTRVSNIIEFLLYIVASVGLVIWMVDSTVMHGISVLITLGVLNVFLLNRKFE